MKPVGEALAVLLVVGVLALNYPVLGIFNLPAVLGGIPVLYLYLFGVWGVGIVIVWLLARRPWDGPD